MKPIQGIDTFSPENVQDTLDGCRASGGEGIVENGSSSYGSELPHVTTEYDVDAAPFPHTVGCTQCPGVLFTYGVSKIVLQRGEELHAGRATLVKEDPPETLISQE